MIDGVKIEMHSEELKAHFDGRAAHHADRIDFYQKNIESLKAAGVTPSNSTGDVFGSHESKMREHREKYTFFKLLADHIVNGETYRLNDNDMSRLELTARFY